MEVNTDFGFNAGTDAQATEANGEVVESLASPFLERIPAQDRDVVGRYIKEWDSGAQKKFREYQGRIKPYSELGSVEDLTKYRNFALGFQQNPEMMFKLMWEGLQQQYGDDFETHLMRILELQAEQEGQQQMADEQYYPGQEYQQEEPDPLGEVTSKLDQMETWIKERETAEREQLEQSKLNELLGQMHEKFGEFDDTWILTRLADGRTIPQALQDWQQMVAKYSQGTQRQAPVVMGGQGGVPSSQVDAAKLRGKDRRTAVEALLAGLEQQG